MTTPSKRGSSATWLALAYTGLVVYASLYPFGDWRWPPGQNVMSLLWLPWPPWGAGFDLWSNALGYIPLGSLLTLALLRTAWPAAGALVVGAVAPSLLSAMCEWAQNFLPSRVPSAKDWTLNTVGASLGAGLALGLHTLGWVQRWQRLRQQWFAPDAAAAMALVALWPVGLLVPLAVPLGLGQVGPELRAALLHLLDGVPWAGSLHHALSELDTPHRALPLLGEWALMALGWLAPCAVLYPVVQRKRHRGVLTAGVWLLALLVMSLAAALNFGPDHVLAWSTPQLWWAMALAAIGAAALAMAAPGLQVVFGALGILALVLGVWQAPVDPYLVHNLQSWEQGRFVRFHGITQWLAWMWPYAALAWLWRRVSTCRR